MQKNILPLIICLLFSVAGFSTTINMCSSCEVKTLTNAINKAHPGDTILIAQGTYNSINTQINKAVTIIGINRPVLDGNMKDEVLVVTASSVQLHGLTICNSNRGSMKDYAGIRVYKCAGITIDNCRLTNTFFGIYLSDSKHITVTNIHSKGANYGKSDTGNGIHLWKCDSVLISNNHLEGHRDGIYLEFAKNSIIRYNHTERNFRYGLHFMFSDNDTYEHNRFNNNGTGVAVMYSKGVHMYYNSFYDNWGDASYGLLLKDMNGGIIQGNTFANNTIGITMEGSNRMRFEKNNFYSNGYGLKVMANCIEDTFRYNNFSGNTFDAATNGQLQQNIFALNYWDKYEGYDLDRNGIGDIPFNPVSLYSVMVEKMPFAVMLMHSFTVDLINRAEKNMPGIVPDTFVDTMPLTKKINQ